MSRIIPTEIVAPIEYIRISANDAFLIFLSELSAWARSCFQKDRKTLLQTTKLTIFLSFVCRWEVVVPLIVQPQPSKNIATFR